MKPQDLNLKLNKIKKVFTTDSIVNLEPTVSSIANYYKTNKFAYSFFADKDFIHMGISRNGQYSKENLLEQVKLVDRYIEKIKAKKVLELAAGRGANSEYLAKRHPDIIFEAVDLPNGQLDYAFRKAKGLENFYPKEGDYHNLGFYPKNYFDVIFIIEALCYSTTKKQVFSQVKRILKKSGVFIIFDGYSGKKESLLNKQELLAKNLAEKSMMVPSFDYYKDFKKVLLRSGFKIIKEENVSELIVPTLKRFETQAKFYFNIPFFLIKLINKIVPAIVVNNLIAGYLLLTLIKLGVAKYMITVISKKN